MKSRKKASRKSPGIIRRGLRTLFPPIAEWKRALPAFGFAILSAILVRLTYQPLHWSALAFVALVPLFWGLRRCKPAMAFWVGWLFGSINGWTFTGWLTIVSRFNEMIYLGILPLALWLGIHIAVALSLIVWFGRRLNPWAALTLGMLTWAGMEFFKMIGALALPYGLLAQSQGGWTSMAHIAAFAGMPLLSALIVGVNLSLMELAAAISARYGHAGAAARVATMFALTAVGLWWGSGIVADRQAAYESEDAFAFRVALLQPNIAQELKFASYASDDHDERLQFQDQITRNQLDQIDELKPSEYDLIVTPESSFTTEFFDVEEHIQRRIYGGVVQYELINRAKDLETPIIAGANEITFRTIAGEPTELVSEGVDPDTGQLYPGYDNFGGLWVFRPTDPVTIQPQSDYRKVHLMPFGEYVPYFGAIPGFAEGVVGIGSFRAGELGAPLGVLIQPANPADDPREVRLGLTICFEDLFPYIHNHYANEGAQAIINTTNDSWFDGSSGPAWHMDMTRWRCIETGLPMLRCTNTGVTAWIDPVGEVVETLPTTEKAVLSATVPLLSEPPLSPYARFGNWFGWLAFLIPLITFLNLLRRERREDDEDITSPYPDEEELLLE